MSDKNKEKVFKMSFASVYPHYVSKIEKKGRNVTELHEVIYWLAGYTETDLQKIIEEKVNFKDFFENAPKFNENANKITGVICGYRVEEIEDPLVQKIRYLDKLIDELAKGKKIEKIFRI